MLQLLGDQAGVAMQRLPPPAGGRAQHGGGRARDAARPLSAAGDDARARCRPRLAGLEAAGWTKPASINGGDCFDLWKMPDGRLGVLLADASGHGIGPALVVSQVRTLVRTLSEMEGDPFTMLQRINARLYDDLPNGRFVTAFVGFVRRTGKSTSAAPARAGSFAAAGGRGPARNRGDGAAAGRVA